MRILIYDADIEQLNYINYTIKLNMDEWPRLLKVQFVYRIREFGLQACYKSLNFER